MATAAVAASDATAKAGFWIRAAAYILDSIIVSVVALILYVVGSIVDKTLGSVLLLLAYIGYWVYFWSGSGGGQTLGMKALDLKVIRTDGSSLTIVQAFIRWVGVLISAFPWFLPTPIGLIWVAFDGNKQGWHDKIAGTYVIKAK